MSVTHAKILHMPESVLYIVFLSLYVSLSSFLSSVLIQTFAVLLIKSAVDYIFLFVFSKGYFKGSEL